MFAFDVENHDGALSRQQSGNDNADALARTGWRFDKDMLTPAKSQEAPAFASNDNSQGRAETMPLEFTLIGKTSGPVEWCAARPKGIDQPGKQRDAAHQTACHSPHDGGKRKSGVSGKRGAERGELGG